MAHRPPIVSSVYSSTYVRLLFDYLSARGLDAERVLGEPPPSPGDRGLACYPAARWRSLLERAAAALHDPLLGLHLGLTITPAHLGVLGYILLACHDVGAALLRWQQYESLISNVARMDVRLEGTSVVMEWLDAPEMMGALVDETALTAIVQFTRNITGTSCSPNEVLFCNPLPPDLRPYRGYFGCPVHFGQPATLIRFPATLLTLSLRQSDAALLKMLEQQANALLAELPHSDDLEQAVRRSIAHLAREGEVSIERVAQELHLSSRTLHRRLARSGCNFRALREDTRRLLATDYLDDPRLTLAEVAWLLGYSELSAFSRAFRRWTGQPPGAFRRVN